MILIINITAKKYPFYPVVIRIFFAKPLPITIRLSPLAIIKGPELLSTVILSPTESPIERSRHSDARQPMNPEMTTVFPLATPDKYLEVQFEQDSPLFSLKRRPR